MSICEEQVVVGSGVYVVKFHYTPYYAGTREQPPEPEEFDFTEITTVEGQSYDADEVNESETLYNLFTHVLGELKAEQEMEIMMDNGPKGVVDSIF